MAIKKLPLLILLLIMQQAGFTQYSEYRIQHHNISGWFVSDSIMLGIDSVITDCKTTLNTLALKYNIQEELRIENYVKIEEQRLTIGSYASENDSLKTEIFVLQENFKRREKNSKKVKFNLFTGIQQVQLIKEPFKYGVSHYLVGITSYKRFGFHAQVSNPYNKINFVYRVAIDYRLK